MTCNGCVKFAAQHEEYENCLANIVLQGFHREDQEYSSTAQVWERFLTKMDARTLQWKRKGVL